MSRYDASHDFAHVQRVRYLAECIAGTESDLVHGMGKQYNRNIVTIAALLHDVGDKKYLPANVQGGEQVLEFLLSAGACKDLAQKVQDIVNSVSYSNEVKNPDQTQKVLERYPELGPIQDADRLDALGAIGVGRCFTYGGAKGATSMEMAISHFKEKLLNLEGMMKTETGKKMAHTRTKRLLEFMAWWDEETNRV